MVFMTILTVLLGGVMVGCAAISTPGIQDSAAPAVPQTAVAGTTGSATIDAQVAALQEERQQLLATLGQFHERVRDLESKLADRGGKEVAKSYDDLLAIKEAELAELRKSSAEHGTVVAQRDAAVGDLAQAHRRIEFLEQQAVRKDQELMSIAGLKAAAAELEVVKHRVRELEAHAVQREAEARALRGVAAERENLATQLQTATVTLNRTKERLAQVEQQLTLKEQSLRAAVSDKQKLAEETAARAGQLKQAMQQLMALEQLVTEKDQQLNVSKRHGNDRERLASQLSIVNMDLTQSRQRFSQLERQLAAKSDEVESLRAQVAERERLLAQASSQTHVKAPGTSTIRPDTKSADKQVGTVKEKTTPTPKGSAVAPASSKAGAGGSADQQPSRLQQAKEDLLQFLQQDLAKGLVSIKQDGRQLSIALAETLLFSSGDVALHPDGTKVLARIGRVIGGAPDKAVQVTGHTDNQPLREDLRKKFADNRALSWARAETARRALIAGGTSPDHVRAIGLADKKPLASNATEAGRQKNRRIEIVVTQFASSSRTATSGTRHKKPSMATLSMPRPHGPR